MLPLRLFLGISFIAAGWDKLSDPTFFDANSTGYIGNQLAGFAPQSPLGGFLTTIAVPNATIFGALVLAGELAIGLGTLLGLFSRTAAIFGCILSLTLWLTASWQVAPFFFGSDLPYAMGWLTLALAPPHPVLSLDGQIRRWRLRTKFSAGAQALSGYTAGQPPIALPEIAQLQPGIARRRFVQVAGATVLAGTVTGVAWATTLASKSATSTSQPSTTTGSETTTTPASTTNPTQAAPTSAPTSAAQTTAAATSPVTAAQTTAAATTTSAATAAATTAPTTSGKVLASVASLPTGSAVNFTTPDTNETAILIHESDGSVKAFSNICTHQGCEVAFNKSAQVLACPCHGAQYSIESGAVLRGPATRALKSFSVKIENGNIVYSQD